MHLSKCMSYEFVFFFFFLVKTHLPLFYWTPRFKIFGLILACCVLICSGCVYTSGPVLFSASLPEPFHEHHQGTCLVLVPRQLLEQTNVFSPKGKAVWINYFSLPAQGGFSVLFSQTLLNTVCRSMQYIRTECVTKTLW